MRPNPFLDVMPPPVAAGGQGGTPAQRRLSAQSFRELSKEVIQEGPRTWLVQGVMVSGTHGVEGGAPKGGKGWDAFDLAVSVATGTPWLEYFDCPTPGPTLIYAAEEDKHEIRRRINAICRARKSAEPLDLPIHIVAAAPHLAVPTDLVAVGEEIARLNPVLVILDPLYRAAGGANYRSVFDMGELLGGMEEVTRSHDAGLFVVHHNNRNRDAKGSDRLSGAGAAEWGRFLITSAEKARLKIEGGTEVVRDFEVVGTSLRDQKFTVTRRITSSDEADPDSELTYWVEVTETAETNDGWPKARHNIHAVSNGQGWPLTYKDIADRIVNWGIWKAGLAQTTFDRESKLLIGAGLFDRDTGSKPYRYWRTDVEVEFEARPPEKEGR